MSLFSGVEPFAGDPILSLNDAFQKDARQDKVNLSIGIYFDDAGRIPVLDCVKRAEAQMLEESGPKPYLPIEGAAAMRRAVQGLLFGPEHPALREGRVCTVQTIGSSGGLRVGADFIQRWLPGRRLLISDPSWDNHRSMFEAAGIQVESYPYFDASTGGVRFEAMLQALEKANEGSLVLLHACCHNPTGVDLSRSQWDTLIPLLKRRQLVPYLDLAYQGYGDGIDEDAYAVRAIAASGLPAFVANSFSKSMSVYGERAGALSVVCHSAEEAERVLGQLKATIRRNYSSPAVHAAGIVARVLTQAPLRQAWEADVAAMRLRIQQMRRALHDGLKALKPGLDFGYVLTQRGMFSYTGLSAAQVDRLREEHAVYLVRSGRLCVSGLSTANVGRTAAAMASVL
jgi:aromatic-amino-acid transaminase